MASAGPFLGYYLAGRAGGCQPTSSVEHEWRFSDMPAHLNAYVRIAASGHTLDTFTSAGAHLEPARGGQAQGRVDLPPA